VCLLQFIHHPNIVRLSEVVYEKDNIILIMEYSEHGDLFDHLGANGALPLSRLRLFIYQSLKALQSLHEKGFAHRDLKSENIPMYLDTCIKVADFGLGRRIPNNGMMSTIWPHCITWHRRSCKSGRKTVQKRTCGRWGSSFMQWRSISSRDTRRTRPDSSARFSRW
jgi:serine/threonine protein kinase